MIVALREYVAALSKAVERDWAYYTAMTILWIFGADWTAIVVFLFIFGFRFIPGLVSEVRFEIFGPKKDVVWGQKSEEEIMYERAERRRGEPIEWPIALRGCMFLCCLGATAGYLDEDSILFVGSIYVGAIQFAGYIVVRTIYARHTALRTNTMLICIGLFLGIFAVSYLDDWFDLFPAMPFPTFFPRFVGG